MTTPESGHLAVLPAEVLRELAPSVGQTLVDCTAGLGGHAELLARAIGPTGRVLLLDVDPANLDRAAARLRALPDPPTISAVPANFALAEAITLREGLRADLVLADLGMSSSQLDDPARGFAFSRDGPLDMRLDPTLVGTAADLVNALPERRLADLIFELGEEPMARRIAARIVAVRARQALATTGELAELVRDAYGARARSSRMHPATRTFMALRMAVNDECGSLERLLDSIERGAQEIAAGRPSWLAPQSRVGIISFHSLEDRPVKRRFRELASCAIGCETAKRPLEATQDEIEKNPRARSAKLRVLRLSGRC